MVDPYVFPFTKESPFYQPLKKAFENMRRNGLLANVLSKYTPVINYECGNPMVKYFQGNIYWIV